MSPTIPDDFRPCDCPTAGRHDVAGEAILHVLPQNSVRHQFRHFGPPRGAISMPLRRVSTVFQTAPTCRGVAPKLARNCRGGSPELARDLPDALGAGELAP
jgi:hypothetical protein